jgi:uncharacterized phage protein (TIGR02220 family)
MLDFLQDRGFLVRYGNGSGDFIQIVNFLKHQHIHRDEPPSKIPAPQEDAIKHRSSTVLAPDLHEYSTVPIRLLANSSKLVDSSYNLEANSLNPPIVPQGTSDLIPYEEIISHLNETAGTSYKHKSDKTRQLIKARWNEGFQLEDFKKVHLNKVRDWKGDPKMEAYIRPLTLYSNKFESYLNQQVSEHSNVAYRTYQNVGEALREEIEAAEREEREAESGKS